MLWFSRAGTFVASVHLSHSVISQSSCEQDWSHQVCVTLPAYVFLFGGTRAPVAGMEVLLLPTQRLIFVTVLGEAQNGPLCG